MDCFLLLQSRVNSTITFTRFLSVLSTEWKLMKQNFNYFHMRKRQSLEKMLKTTGNSANFHGQKESFRFCFAWILSTNQSSSERHLWAKMCRAFFFKWKTYSSSKWTPQTKKKYLLIITINKIFKAIGKIVNVFLSNWIIFDL